MQARTHIPELNERLVLLQAVSVRRQVHQDHSSVASDCRPQGALAGLAGGQEVRYSSLAGACMHQTLDASCRCWMQTS